MTAPDTPAPSGNTPRRATALGHLFRWVFAALVTLSFAVNFLLLALLGLLLWWAGSFREDASLTEHLHSGRRLARDKVAVVRVEGVILEGTLGFVRKEIDQAAADDRVKAVVVRINSPGGTITA